MDSSPGPLNSLLSDCPCDRISLDQMLYWMDLAKEQTGRALDSDLLDKDLPPSPFPHLPIPQDTSGSEEKESVVPIDPSFLNFERNFLSSVLKRYSFSDFFPSAVFFSPDFPC